MTKDQAFLTVIKKRREKLMQFIFICIGIFLIAPTHALAKRGGSREGFNFGTSLYMNSGTEPNIAGTNASEKKTMDYNSTRYRPFVGYSFKGVLNLGLGIESESEQRQSSILAGAKANKERYLVDETKQLAGTFLFSKILFGRYFFMDVSVGYYTRHLNKSTELELESNSGSFSGQREKYAVKSAGPGYQYGLGLEAPISEGFHFTAAYYNRILSLTGLDPQSKVITGNVKEGNSLVNLGISYYFN